MSRYTRTDASSIAGLNAELEKIKVSIDSLLDRDGTAPNTMEADLDMNSNDILNAGSINGNTINADSVVVSGTELGGGGAIDVGSNYAWTGTHSHTQDITVNGNTVYHTGNLDAQVISFIYEEGTTYTLTPEVDANKFIRSASASPTTFTVSSGGWTAGQTVTIFQEGAGQVTIAAEAGVTIRTEVGYNIKGQYGLATLVFIEDDGEGVELWSLCGSMVA